MLAKLEKKKEIKKEEDLLPDGDPVLGRRIYNQQCLTCHSLEGSPYSNGPLLGNILNQKAGTMTKYRYS
jgi:cytochrome c2